MSCPHCGAEGIEHTPADLAQFTADMTHIAELTHAITRATVAALPAASLARMRRDHEARNG